MEVPALFGIAVCVMLLIVWVSCDHVRQKLGLLLLFAWASTNLAVNTLGFERAPLLVPSMDAAIAIFVAMLGYTNRSRVAAVIFGIYVVVGATHVAAFVFHAQGTYNYYATLNVAFASQLIILGASSARLAFHRWTVRSRERLRPHIARG